jgi:hypothetical protein
MMLFRQGGPNDGMLEAETARLTRLATDMERVLEGILPEAIVRRSHRFSIVGSLEIRWPLALLDCRPGIPRLSE